MREESLRVKDLGTAFERFISQRAVLRNQLGVAMTALKEICEFQLGSTYVRAVAHGALTAIQQLQDEADDAR